MKKKISLILALMLVISLSTACGAPVAPSTSASSTSPSAQDAGSSPANAVQPASAGEKVLRIARAEDVTYWDPLDNFNIVNWTLNRAMYDQLVFRQLDGSFKPRLATEWKMLEDGRVWNFKLRNDVVFHNGEKLNAECVKFTVERFLTENLRQSANWNTLEGVDVVGEYEVNIKFKAPYGAFMPVISELSILPKQAFETLGKDKLFETPIGSGPFKFVSWTQGQKIVLEKNNDYWGEKTKVDKIEYYPITEDNTRVSALRSGDMDMIDNVPADQIALITQDGNLKVEASNTVDSVYIGLKCDAAPFNDVKARQAVSMAINRQLIVDKILGGGGAANWPFAPGVIGANPDYPMQEQNIEEAKKLLQASGYDGRELTFIAPTTWYARTKEVLQAVISDLTEVGFNIKLEMMDGATFMEKRGGGQYDMYYTGGSHIGGDPILFLYQRIVDDVWKSGFNSQELKDKIVAVQQQADPAKRQQEMQAIGQLMMDQYGPFLFVYQIQNVKAQRANVTGGILYPDKLFDFTYCDIT